jgi:hypothetical protein
VEAEGELGTFPMPSSEGGGGGDGGVPGSSGGGGGGSNAKYIVTCMGVIIYGFWIGNWIYRTTRTSNYSAFANSHNLQFTTARTKSSQSAVSSPVVVW